MKAPTTVALLLLAQVAIGKDFKRQDEYEWDDYDPMDCSQNQCGPAHDPNEAPHRPHNPPSVGGKALAGVADQPRIEQGMPIIPRRGLMKRKHKKPAKTSSSSMSRASPITLTSAEDVPAFVLNTDDQTAASVEPANMPQLNGTALFEPGLHRYQIVLEIGSERLALPVDINTGANDFWVLSENEGGPYPVPGYSTTNETNNQLHRTKQKFGATDQQGSVKGQVYQDAMWLGTYLTDEPLCTNCSFGVSIEAENSGGTVDKKFQPLSGNPIVNALKDSYTRFSGTMGLGMAKLDDKKATGFLPWLARTYQITSFALNLGAYRATYSFGTIDSNRYEGELTYTPAKRVSYGKAGPAWGIDLVSFGVGEEVTPSPLKSKVQVILDSGTEYMFLPQDLVAQYYTQVEGAQIKSKIWEVPCESDMPAIQFKLDGGFVGNLTDVDSFMETSGNQKDYHDEYYDDDEGGEEEARCIGRLQVVENGHHATLGLPVFRKHYMVFDLKKEQVGFAETISDFEYDDDEEYDWQGNYFPDML